MRVLQVVGKMNIGGAEQLLMNVYRSIDREKFQFDFLSFYDEGEKGFFDDEIISLGGNIINIPKPSAYNFKKNVDDICAVLKDKNYDAVHTHIGTNCVYALIAAKKCGIKIRIAHSHNTPNPDRNVLSKIRDPFFKYLSNKYLTHCCACSLEAAKFRFTEGNITNKYSYVPNSVNFDAYLKSYDIDAVKKALSINPQTKVILQVGNFKHQKNQKYSLDIAKMFCDRGIDFKLLFAGKDDTDYGKMVKDQAKEFNLDNNIIFLGSRTDIPELMAMADVMIMPSVYEGLGIVLLEAQASGLPCLVSETIQPEADMKMGIFKACNLSDIDSWVENIIDIINNDKPSLDARKASVEKSEFKLDNTVKIFESLYKLS